MKRLSANVAALRRLIETGITVGSVSENLHCVDESDIDDSLWEDLRERGFDRCGVRHNDRLLGYVERPDVSSGETDVHVISVGQLIAETTPLWQAMPRLVEARWLFVLTADGPDGIVAVADLAKQPARLLMFGMISLLEMTMLALIRREHPNNSWKVLLTPGRIAKGNVLLEERRKKEDEIDLADCLQWCDKATICATSDRVRERWGIATKNECERLLKRGQELRDQLAHSQHPAPDGDWHSVVEWLRCADQLIETNLAMINEPAAEDAYAN